MAGSKGVDKLRKHYKAILKGLRKSKLSEEQKREVARKHIEVMADAMKKGFSFSKAHEIAEEVQLLMSAGYTQVEAYGQTMSRGMQVLADIDSD